MTQFTATDATQYGELATAGLGSNALPEVIARIPDLAAGSHRSAKEASPAMQRRLLGTLPGLLFLGVGGLLLFVAAVVPYLFKNKDSSAATAEEQPGIEQPAASPGDPSPQPTSVTASPAPAAAPSTPVKADVEPTFAAKTINTPEAINWSAQPYPCTDDPRSQPEWLTAARARNASRMAVNDLPAKDSFGTDRPATAASYSETLQANRTASPGYRQPESRANGAMSLGNRAAMPESNHPAANYPDTVRPTEPGAAQFEGTIQKPTFPNNYDRTGSSIR